MVALQEATALIVGVGRIGAVKIWQDPKLEGGQLFDQTIKNAIDTSALFLAFTSTGYLASEYCRQEVKWFCQKAGTQPLGLAVGDRMRIFNLQLNNIPFPDWPEEFGRTSGFPFHDAADQEDLGGEWTFRFDDRDRGRGWIDDRQLVGVAGRHGS